MGKEVTFDYSKTAGFISADHYLWSDPEKGRKDERVGSRSGCHCPAGCHVYHWYETSNVCDKEYLDLYCYGISSHNRLIS